MKQLQHQNYCLSTGNVDLLLKEAHVICWAEAI